MIYRRGGSRTAQVMENRFLRAIGRFANRPYSEWKNLLGQPFIVCLHNREKTHPSLNTTGAKAESHNRKFKMPVAYAS
ncbi:hypothetical protein D0T87_12425 [Bacteroides sp. 51]|nr:hypothetical protein [Bacteroides sp. 51]